MATLIVSGLGWKKLSVWPTRAKLIVWRGLYQQGVTNNEWKSGVVFVVTNFRLPNQNCIWIWLETEYQIRVRSGFWNYWIPNIGVEWQIRRASAYGRAFFCPLAKKRAFMLLLLILGHFWCSVVISITFSSNLSNFEKKSKKNKKKPKQIPKIYKNLIFSKNPRQSKIIKENPKNP